MMLIVLAESNFWPAAWILPVRTSINPVQSYYTYKHSQIIAHLVVFLTEIIKLAADGYVAHISKWY